MDALRDLLESAHLSGGVYFRCELRAPWGMQVPRTRTAEFHIVVRGQCWLRIPGRASPVALRAGDLAVCMHGDAHALLDRPNGKALPAEVVLQGQNLERYGPVKFGGDGPAATVLCGYFRFDRDSRNPIIDALPRFLLVQGGGAGTAALQSVIDLMTEEARAARPGAEVVVNRLCDVLFVHILRAYLEQHPDSGGLLAALADVHIGAALDLIHRHPEQRWSLGLLARQVGMSRSALAARFHALVGKPPMQYLTDWRMETARRLLAEGQLPQAAIAERVGYGSEAAFSKGFKRLLGVAPGAYRRAASR